MEMTYVPILILSTIAAIAAFFIKLDKNIDKKNDIKHTTKQ